MSNLTEARDTRELLGSKMFYEREVAASNTVYAGALVAQNSDGKALPAADTSGLIVLGRAENTAAAGETVKISTGMFLYANGTGTEALTAADIGSVAFALDDHTVGKVGGTNAIAAGVVREVNSDGVVIETLCPRVFIKPGAAVADCTPAGSTATDAETKLNALLASLRAAGIIKTA